MGTAQGNLKMRLEMEDSGGTQVAVQPVPCQGCTFECKSKAHPHFILKLGDYLSMPTTG